LHNTDHEHLTDSANAGLAERLRAATGALHRKAERSGIVGDLLKNKGSQRGYALLIRNLLPVYQNMERGLERHRYSLGVRAIAQPLYRSAALLSDVISLYGPEWELALPLLPAGDRYAHFAAEAGLGDGSRLIAHAYVRYLGDLSGGQILKRLLSKSLALHADCLTFYDFPEIDDLSQYKTEYRNAFDLAGMELGPDAFADVVEEAQQVFCRNIELSEDVNAFLAATGSDAV
jgi:heme oxygenase (biliverdin-producing, ferredoxin)